VGASYTSGKGLITRIYRKLKILNPPPKITFSKEEVQTAKKHTKNAISGHKGNANENHTKIPPHPC
jgi:hypothetical protein